MKKVIFCIIVIGISFFLGAEFPITLYHAHDTFNFTEEMFAEHLDFLKDNDYHTVTLDDFMDWRLDGAPMPLRPIVLTFDDNYLGMRYIAYPLLKERGFNAVNFAHMIAINRPDNGDFRPDWPELGQWEDEGVLYTESHSWNHPYLTGESDEDAWFEIHGSKVEIEQNMTGKTCKYLAYPYGDYDQRIIDKTEAAGYVAAFTTESIRARRDSALYEVPRLATDGVSLEVFKNRVGFYDLPPDPPGEGWTFDSEGVHFHHDVGFVQPSGEGNGQFDGSLSTPNNYDGIVRLAFDSTGRLYLGGNNGTVWYTDDPFSENPTYQTVLDESLANGIQGIAIDGNDNVYVSGDDAPDGVIYSYNSVGNLRWTITTGRITGCTLLSTGELLVTNMGGKFFLYDSANGTLLGEHQVSGLANHVRDIAAAPDDTVFAIQSGSVKEVTGGNAGNLSGYSASSFGDASYNFTDWSVRPSVMYYDGTVISSNFSGTTGATTHPRVFVQDADNGSLLQIIDEFTSESFSPSGVAVLHYNDEDYLFVSGQSSQIRRYTMDGEPPEASDYFGLGYRYSVPGDGSTEAGWSLYLPAHLNPDGDNYRIHVWWPESPEWATNTPFEIQDDNGIHTFNVNQQENSGQWNNLGTYTFDGDTPAHIRINNDADGAVVVDGLWIEPVEPTSVSDWYLY